MRAYQHTQKSLLYTIFLVLLSLAFLCMYIDSENNILYIISFAFILFVIYWFSKMTVSVDSDYLKVHFWFRLFTKKFFLEDIESIKLVRNKWYHGWGIRFLYLPDFVTLYSVFWLDAVEIELTSWKKYRIGTDDAQGLEKVLKSGIS